MNIFDKNTSHGRALRTGLQAIVGLVSFIFGILTIPGLSNILADNNILSITAFGTWLGIITYIQNALEDILENWK